MTVAKNETSSVVSSRTHVMYRTGQKLSRTSMRTFEEEARHPFESSYRFPCSRSSVERCLQLLKSIWSLYNFCFKSAWQPTAPWGFSARPCQTSSHRMHWRIFESGKTNNTEREVHRDKCVLFFLFVIRRRADIGNVNAERQLRGGRSSIPAGYLT